MNLAAANPTPEEMAFLTECLNAFDSSESSNPLPFFLAKANLLRQLESMATASNTHTSCQNAQEGRFCAR